MLRAAKRPPRRRAGRCGPRRQQTRPRRLSSRRFPGRSGHPSDSQTGELVLVTVLCYFCSRAPGPTPATGCLGPPSSPRSGWPWPALPTPAQTSALPDRATVTAAGSRAASLLTPDKILGQWLSRYFGEQPAAGSRAASLPGPRPSAGLKLGTSPRAQNWQSRCQVGTFRRRLAGSGPAGSTGKQARTVALIHGR